MTFGTHRKDDPKARVFPSLGRNEILWTTPVNTSDMTSYVRMTVELANGHPDRKTKKEAKLYTSHSPKVGGAFECALRGYNLHEGQQFTRYWHYALEGPHSHSRCTRLSTHL